MEQEVIILSADFWSIQDQKTGERNEGTTVWYLTTSSIDVIKNNEKSYGYVPLKVTMDKDFIHTIAAIGGCPCKALAHCVIKTQGGKQVIAPDSFEFPKK